MIKCSDCDKPLTSDEIQENLDQCFECNISLHIGRLSYHMREARITFEEVIRKLIQEIDK
jgi:acetyl-CoA carboxylase beta subunit